MVGAVRLLEVGDVARLDLNLAAGGDDGELVLVRSVQGVGQRGLAGAGGHRRADVGSRRRVLGDGARVGVLRECRRFVHVGYVDGDRDDVVARPVGAEAGVAGSGDGARGGGHGHGDAVRLLGFVVRDVTGFDL